MNVSNLRDYPHFADLIADRGWNEWWTESGLPLGQYRAHLESMLESDGVPFALVAHENGVYAGSVLVISNDHDERPQYAPWIAALWVEPGFRRQGIAARLIAESRGESEKSGHPSCYLCATSDKAPYYLKQGFTLIERDVAGLDIFVIGGAQAS
ncbi:GNAT family N-acetyltransferase [Agrobacterium tumefaciens]|uniref:GNAT family N-acetyltransferase n=1 Tax=Agrobacterium tumefaciens TaxID=358 RepID=UPI00287E5A21|nr:GNAT family N-acetyltransferase [Agrobacterium tumefaciens]MDS7596582.1 GNAT family N-acetyltransferase [Agrobacterium tumefaciens]